MSAQIGDEAPDFELPNQLGEKVRLSSFRGQKNVVLIFFPKAFTGTCTAELCAIRDDKPDFVNDDVVTFGVSCDSIPALKMFAEQQGYDYDLLSDWWPHGETASAYGVFSPELGHALRATFIIDTEGIITAKVTSELGDPRSNDDYRSALAELS